jgi:Polyketide cyclase / dehydrase and lipid transport.
MLSGCVSNLQFQNVIEIDAPVSVVFSIITDYEQYPKIIPMLHDSVVIKTVNKTGVGVEWESTGSFKGHKFTSTWTVTEYIQDQKVAMKDLKTNIGETALIVESISENKTRYIMSIQTKMYKPYENDFIRIYKEEMSIIKREAEKKYSGV